MDEGNTFGGEVARKLLNQRGSTVDITREELISILKGSVRDQLRTELKDSMQPIREDVAAIWERIDRGDQCSGCVNRDRITRLEGTDAVVQTAVAELKQAVLAIPELKLIVGGITKMMWMVAGGFGIVLLKDLVLHWLVNK
jgi:hypothetical protein